MTQQYIRGELSVRLGELCDGQFTATDLLVLRDVRRCVESTSTIELPHLAAKVMNVVDAACWASLALGDLAAFDRTCREEASLYEFVTSAGLLR